MDFVTFEPLAGGAVITLLATEFWNNLVRFPKLVNQMEMLQEQKKEDQDKIEAFSKALSELQRTQGEALVRFITLNTQCEEERKLSRETSADWNRSRLAIAEAISEMRAGLTIIRDAMMQAQQAKDIKEALREGK